MLWSFVGIRGLWRDPRGCTYSLCIPLTYTDRLMCIQWRRWRVVLGSGSGFQLSMLYRGLSRLTRSLSVVQQEGL